MKLNKSLAVLSLTALLGMTACSSEPGPAEAPDVAAAGESSETSSPKADEPKRSPRGNLIKEIGQGAGVSSVETEKQESSFVVNSIEVDPACPNPQTGEYPPENGHFIVLDVSMETFPALAESPWPTFDLNPYGMKVIAENGTTSNAEMSTISTYYCFDDAQMIPAGGIGPAEKVTGKIVLDSEVASGVLVVTANSGMGPGWEYTFGGAKPTA